MSRKYRTGLSTVSQSYGPPQPTKADAYPQADRWSAFEKTGAIATTINPRFNFRTSIKIESNFWPKFGLSPGLRRRLDGADDARRSMHQQVYRENIRRKVCS
jgi:hypothetical protein